MNTLTPVLHTLLDCVTNQLNEEGRPVGLAFIAPGQAVAYDDCCQGQAWVRLVSLTPTGFPAGQQAIRCGVNLLNAALEVGVIRCAHTIDDQGRAPTAAEMTADATLTHDDAFSVLNALVCCFHPTLSHIQTLSIGTWTPLGVEGGCVGGQWEATLRIDPCVDC